jgi:outer membrane receptor protein involved in Fe transport
MVFVNYTDSWLDTGCSRAGGCDLSSFVTTGVRTGYRFEEAGFLSNSDLNVAVDNVFDRDPPFDLTAGGYNSTRNASTLGRLVSLSIRKKW